MGCFIGVFKNRLNVVYGVVFICNYYKIVSWGL